MRGSPAWHSGPIPMLRMSFGTAEDGRAWIGRESPERVADATVGEGRTRAYCALVEDGNPRFWRGGESPPGLVQAWTNPLPWHPDTEARPFMFALEVPLPGTHIINVSNDVTYHARHYVGERLAVRETVLDVSELKRTRLGEGHFITTRSVYAVGDRVVAVAENVVFRYLEPE